MCVLCVCACFFVYEVGSWSCLTGEKSRNSGTQCEIALGLGQNTTGTMERKRRRWYLMLPEPTLAVSPVGLTIPSSILAQLIIRLFTRSARHCTVVASSAVDGSDVMSWPTSPLFRSVASDIGRHGGGVFCVLWTHCATSFGP